MALLRDQESVALQSFLDLRVVRVSSVEKGAEMRKDCLPLTRSKWLLIFLRMVRAGKVMQMGHIPQPSGLCHLHPCSIPMTAVL